MQVYHNYIRPHEGLEGKTPAEACGIELKGENKWITLIQNASIKSLSEKCYDLPCFRQVDIKIHSIFLLISFFSELLKFNLNQKLLNVNHNVSNIYLG